MTYTPKARTPLHPPLHISFTVAGQKLIEQSFREALQIGHSQIGTEHLLLAWIRLIEKADTPYFGDEADRIILAKTGKTTQEQRSLVIGLLSRYQPVLESRGSLTQIGPEEDLTIEIGIPYRLQVDFNYKYRDLDSFIATPGKCSDISPTLSVITTKLVHNQPRVSLLKSEVLSYCIWYGLTLSQLLPSDHPFNQLYELFLNTIQPGLHE